MIPGGFDTSRDDHAGLLDHRLTFNPSIPQRQGDRFGARVGGGFIENGIDVELHGPFADAETVGDLFVGQSLCGER